MEPDFEKCEGLVPVIVQDYKSLDVLMLAYMNKEAWEATLNTKKGAFLQQIQK